jgi:hypothetical protein
LQDRARSIARSETVEYPSGRRVTLTWQRPSDAQDNEPRTLVDPNVTPEQIRKAMADAAEEARRMFPPMTPEQMLRPIGGAPPVQRPADPLMCPICGATHDFSHAPDCTGSVPRAADDQAVGPYGAHPMGRHAEAVAKRRTEATGETRCPSCRCISRSLCADGRCINCTTIDPGDEPRRNEATDEEWWLAFDSPTDRMPLAFRTRAAAEEEVCVSPDTPRVEGPFVLRRESPTEDGCSGHCVHEIQCLKRELTAVRKVAEAARALRDTAGAGTSGQFLVHASALHELSEALNACACPSSSDGEKP